MKPAVKVILYLALAVLAAVSLRRVRIEFESNNVSERRLAQGLAGENRDPDPAPEVASALTNLVVNGVTNLAATGAGAAAEAGAAVTNLESVAAGAAGAVTNGLVKGTKPGTQAPGSPSKSTGKGAAATGNSRMGGWMAGFVISLLGMAALVSWDVSQWFAHRANRALGVDGDITENKDPEYDAAEAEWAKGNHLDAINMMREYLSQNPSEQYVALRIAEIYEKDLKNYLAAALEYEEILNHKLPREKWGWTALRLSNLYSGRLNQPDKAIATLERVNRDYPETAAAKKARERLGLPDPTEEPVGEMDVNRIGQDPAGPDSGSDSGSGPALPSGFKRKK